MKNKTIYIAIGVVMLLGLTSFFIVKRKKSKFVVLLLGGLDNRNNDLSIQQQENLLQKGIGNNNKVKSFRYTDKSGIIKQIKSNKNVKIVLFSAGCQYSEEIAIEMQKEKINLNRLYIVEPYAPSINTKKSVQQAVFIGVPSKNVIVGDNINVGKGIIKNTTSTPPCSPYHWCALEMVGQMLVKK